MKSLLCCIAVATNFLDGCPDSIPSRISGWAWAEAVATAIPQLTRGRLSSHWRAVDLPALLQKLHDKDSVSSGNDEGASGLKDAIIESQTCGDYRKLLADYTHDLLKLRNLSRRRKNAPLCTDRDASAPFERRIGKARALQNFAVRPVSNRRVRSPLEPFDIGALQGHVHPILEVCLLILGLISDHMLIGSSGILYEP
ncbi:hypothetical protein CERZMDRAFT_88069 [Cercospora zeae-maydis SCOH1-5]|uniref:Uncharacterized protein n=1 Tax=Cercospora zeae-maydis SCOH1-5 TaxID=717836 RepID=A0A6A6F3X4_9PEZI|nr:hypothetical protein CERZMDRAFT_88069 [Cercospora zeae-maydis SCOH1-5]